MPSAVSLGNHTIPGSTLKLQGQPGMQGIMLPYMPHACPSIHTSVQIVESEEVNVHFVGLAHTTHMCDVCGVFV